MEKPMNTKYYVYYQGKRPQKQTKKLLIDF